MCLCGSFSTQIIEYEETVLRGRFIIIEFEWMFVSRYTCPLLKLFLYVQASHFPWHEDLLNILL
jgi:hypothetical protein